MGEFESSIGKRIAARRVEVGLTQHELAVKLGVSVKHVSECERGVSSFSWEKMIRLSEILDCSIDYIVKGEVSDEILKVIPPSLKEILCGDDSKERNRLLGYMQMYGQMCENFTEGEVEK